jgi:hypothetical protein
VGGLLSVAFGGAGRCIMTFWHDRVSWLLLALAIACFVVGAFPLWREWVDPANGDQVSEYRLGFWFSPVYQHVRRDHRLVLEQANLLGG